MPWLDVYALDKHLCRIKTEPGWTGRELKEAIEEATAWDFLVCVSSGFRGLGVSGSWFRGLGFWVWGLEFSGFGFRV